MYRKLGRHTIVLLGVGHTNAHVLKEWKMRPIRDCELVCISDYPIATYSGMMPAVLAGQVPLEQMQIDLVRLCQSANARLILDRVTSIDPENRAVHFAERPSLAFDFLSIGIGSRPTLKGVQCDAPELLMKVKPMQTFLARLKTRLKSIADENQPTRIAVVGGGVGSIEIAFCLRQRLAARERDFGGLGDPEITLITASGEIGEGLHEGTRSQVGRACDAQRIHRLTGSRVTRIAPDGLQLDDGSTHAFNAVVWATSARAHPVMDQFGLDQDERGFLWTRPTLQSLHCDHIFAVGDSGTVQSNPTPKAGVYAVRQGPVLWSNLQRQLAGRRLKPYRPQSDFLKLINLGNGTAIGEYRGFAFHNRWAWYWKDRIDTRFMKMYQDYRAMQMKPEHAEDPQAMRCLGCGGKVGGALLADVLHELEVPTTPEVIVGLDQPDDAAVIRTTGEPLSVTTDFFAAPFNDPWLIGRIALLNSASDCFVMGGRPHSALAIIEVPEGHPRAQRQVLREVMGGSIQELRKMGAALVGGHSIEGPRLVVGFTMLADQQREPHRKKGLRPGDRVILSKPLGTGAMLVAWMQSQLRAEDLAPLLDTMLTSNEVALRLLSQFPVTALTDVTGFGLAGHLVELLEAGRAEVRLDLESVPLIPGSRQFFERGIESTLAPDNRQLVQRVSIEGCDELADARWARLFDPQTGGGLLFGIAAEQSAAAVDFLREHGHSHAAVIGEVLNTGNRARLILNS